MTKWTKAVPDNELDTAFFNNYFISLTEKECHVLKFKILQFCHVLSNICRAICISLFLHTEDNPAACGVGESTDGFPYGFGETT